MSVTLQDPYKDQYKRNFKDFDRFLQAKNFDVVVDLLNGQNWETLFQEDILSGKNILIIGPFGRKKLQDRTENLYRLGRIESVSFYPAFPVKINHFRDQPVTKNLAMDDLYDEFFYTWIIFPKILRFPN